MVHIRWRQISLGRLVPCTVLLGGINKDVIIVIGHRSIVLNTFSILAKLSKFMDMCKDVNTYNLFMSMCLPIMVWWWMLGLVLW